MTPPVVLGQKRCHFEKILYSQRISSYFLENPRELKGTENDIHFGQGVKTCPKNRIFQIHGVNLAQIKIRTLSHQLDDDYS